MDALGAAVVPHERGGVHGEAGQHRVLLGVRYAVHAVHAVQCSFAFCCSHHASVLCHRCSLPITRYLCTLVWVATIKRSGIRSGGMRENMYVSFDHTFLKLFPDFIQEYKLQ